MLKYLEWRVYVQKKSLNELKQDVDQEKMAEFIESRIAEIKKIESHIPLDKDYKFYDDEKYACDFHYHYLGQNNGKNEDRTTMLHFSKYLQMYMDIIKS